MSIRVQTPATDAEFEKQAVDFCRLFYGSWAEDYPQAQVVICNDQPHFRRADIASVADPEGIARKALAASSPTTSGWVNSQLLMRTPAKRGTAADCDGFTALIADLDLDGELPEGEVSGHKDGKLPRPTHAEAAQMLDEVMALVGMPTAIIRSSREGLQLWWKLDGVLPKGELSARWKQVWEDLGTRYGRDMDAGCSDDLARVLRIPGVWRVKPGCEPFRCHLTAWNPTAELRVAELDSMLPPLRTKTAPVRTSATGAVVPRDSDWEPTPGEALLDEKVDGIQMLDALLHGEYVEGGWKWDGAASPVSAHVHDGISWTHSHSVIEALELQAHDGKAGLSASSLVRRMMGSTRAKAAPVIDWLSQQEDPINALYDAGVDRWDGPDVMPLEDWQNANYRALRADVPAVEAEPQKAAPVDELALAKAIINPDGQKFFLLGRGDDQFRVTIGGTHHGIAVKREAVETDDDGQPVLGPDGKPVKNSFYSTLTDVVAIRVGEKVTHRSAKTGQTESLMNVLVIGPTRGGWKQKMLTDVPIDQSTDVRWLIHRANVGGTWDLSTSKVPAEVAQVLLNLGLSEMKREVQFGRAGWADDDGILRYVTPNGSVRASGLEPEVQATGEKVGGFSRLATAEDFASADEMLRDYLAIWPKGAPVLGGQLGVMLAAPLRTTNGVFSYLHGRADSGKTRLSHPLLSFVTGSTSPKPDIDLKRTSQAGVLQYIEARQSTFVVADDLKVSEGSGSKGTIEERQSLMYDLISSAYDGVGKGRGTATGEAAVKEQLFICGHATGEVTFPDNSMTTKSLMLGSIGPGDIDWTKVEVKGRTNADGSPMMRTRVDGWCIRWAATANALMASYIHELLLEAEKAGGLGEFTRRQDERRSQLTAELPASRASENVALALLGWKSFAAFLARHGVHLSVDFTEAITSLTEVNELGKNRTSLEHRITEAIAARLQTGQGYFATQHGDVPRGDAASMGWTQSGDRWMQHGIQMGTVSDDSRWVRITSAQARAALGKTITSEQGREGLLKLVPVELRSRYDGKRGDPRVAAPEMGGQQAMGYTIPTSVFTR